MGRRLACFAFLAEAADGFAQAHGKGGDGFQALLAAVRKAAVILAADFRQQEFGVAQDSGERIVHLVAEHFTERFSIQDIFHASKLLRVDVLLDSREALDRAAREDYVLIICDMKMPELDGEHFYQALALAQNPLRERFLFVTGDVLAAHTREFLERNHLPHVAKPFRVEELTEKVRSALEATSPRASSRAPAAKKNAARK